MKPSEIMMEVWKMFQVEGYEKPISIEVGEHFAEGLKKENPDFFKRVENTRFHYNECMFSGILIIAPKNFYFFN